MPRLQLRTMNIFSSIILTQETILNIRALDPSKARGWDGVSPLVIKSCDLSIVTAIQIIIEACIRRGIFPEMWKKSNVSSIHKMNLKILRKIFPFFLFW